MSTAPVLDQLLAVVAGMCGGSPAISGRVVDQVGFPVQGAVVRIPGRFAQADVGRAVTNADGRFAMETSPDLPARYELVVQGQGVERRVSGDGRPPVVVHDVALVLPLRLGAAVGDGVGAEGNRPADVRRVQDRLHRLGRLTDAQVADEAEDPDASAPPGPGTMAALADHLAASFGRRLPVTRVDPTGPAFDALAADAPFPLAELPITQPVGPLPGAATAAPADAESGRVVQRRLNQLGLLPRPHWRAEADPALPWTVAGRPRTLAAIAAWERGQAGGSLQAIVPGARNARLLGDPFTFGARPLGESVGEGGRNRPLDVRRVQERLGALGLITPETLAAEQDAAGEVPPDGRVDDMRIPQTIAGIRLFRREWLADAAPARGVVDPVDDTLARLNHPAPVLLEKPLVTHNWRGNDPADVRKAQDRLLAIGLLSAEDHAWEKADPRAEELIHADDLPRTFAALERLDGLAAPLELSFGVGAGETNLPADLGAVQDRLHALGYLADDPYGNERVSTGGAPPADLTFTFAAIARVRREFFGLPEAAEGQPWTAHPQILPGDETDRFLSAPLHYGRPRLRLRGSVGRDGWNFPADVRAVQARLREMRLVTGDEAKAEPLVDPDRPGRVGAAALQRTLEGIRRLRASLLRQGEPHPERVDAYGADALLLENRPAGVRAPFAVEQAVGAGGANRPDDVARVQRRLWELGFLADDDYQRESALLPAGADGIAEGDLPATLVAIGRWQSLMLGAPGDRRVEPFSETVRTLGWPLIPRRVQLPLAHRVGPVRDPRKPPVPRNGYADVRRVQDRLFELGAMEGFVYFSDRVDPSHAGQVPDERMATTRAAIRRLQETLSGLGIAGPDEAVDPDGRSVYVMEDPSYGTPTLPNPSCGLRSAGPAALRVTDAHLDRTFRAIEKAESGVSSSGEIPALLRTGAGVPASFGSAQVVGGTGMDKVKVAAAASFRAFYGLDPETVKRLNARAVKTVELFDDIDALVAGQHWTEAELLRRVADFVPDPADLLAATGLGPADVERIFRTAQFHRHLAVARQLELPHTDLFEAGKDIHLAGRANIQPHAADNIHRLRLSPDSVETYYDNPGYYEEQKQGWVTRALFLAPEGQLLRNLLTDDTGHKIGRFVIQTNWGASSTLGLAAEDRARITAFMHNRGGSAATLARQLGDPASDLMKNDYATRVYNAWKANP